MEKLLATQPTWKDGLQSKEFEELLGNSAGEFAIPLEPAPRLQRG